MFVFLTCNSNTNEQRNTTQHNTTPNTHLAPRRVDVDVARARADQVLAYAAVTAFERDKHAAAARDEAAFKKCVWSSVRW
jgi:hypothetical protein